MIKTFLSRNKIKLIFMIMTIVLFIGANRTYIHAGALEKEGLIKLNLDAENNFLPNGTKIMWAYYYDDEIYLNFNENILNYSGLYYEEKMLEEIYSYCRKNTEAKRISILINSEKRYLREGHETSHIELITF